MSNNNHKLEIEGAKTVQKHHPLICSIIYVHLTIVETCTLDAGSDLGLLRHLTDAAHETLYVKVL